MISLSLFIIVFIVVVVRNASANDIDTPPTPVLVSPELKRRLERVLELSDLPTARMVLRLLERDPQHREPQVVKRLLKGINSFQQQVLSLTNQFLQTPINEATPISLVDTVLFLVQDDVSLFQWYMTRKERGRLGKSIARYRKLYWPENQAALEDCVHLLQAAKALRDMIVRLHQGVEAVAWGEDHDSMVPQVTTTTLDMSVLETKQLTRVALRRMKTLCKQRVSATGDNDIASTTFTEEVDDYLSTLDALLIDRSDQQDQLAIVLALWQNLCLAQQ